MPDEFDFLVAEYEGGLAGMVVWRATASDEKEILNLAVDPAFRRRGIARALLTAISAPAIFLEVRESNQAARMLYRNVGFQEAGLRKAYYQDPVEAAIVMRLQS